MKTTFILTLAAMITLPACNLASSKDAVKVFIPGTYIWSSQHEYGKEFDTLLISLQNEAANEYKLIRKWRYARVLDGHPIEPEYKTSTTTAVYDADSKLLKETQTGDSYSFDVARKVLFAGSTQYKKLK